MSVAVAGPIQAPRRPPWWRSRRGSNTALVGQRLVVAAGISEDDMKHPVIVNYMKHQLIVNSLIAGGGGVAVYCPPPSEEEEVMGFP